MNNLSRSLYGNASTVGRGKSAKLVKQLFLDKDKKKADAARKSKKYLKAMQLHTEIKRLRTPQESEESEIDELETVEDGVIKLAARSGLDLKGNTATIDQVVKILKTFIKGKLKDVVFVENQDGVPVVTLDGIMKTIRKDPSIIGL